MSLPLAHGPAAPARAVAIGAVKIVLGTVALAVSAKVQVPFWPVPMTMQTLAVLLLGVGYGPRLGALTVLAYLAEGMAGLPVFAGAGAGLTGGFLVGFVPAAAVVGWLAQRGWTAAPVRGFAVMLAGHAAVFVPGVAWLATLIGWDKAVALGFVPFIAGTLVKSALAAGLAVAGRRAG